MRRRWCASRSASPAKASTAAVSVRRTTANRQRCMVARLIGRRRGCGKPDEKAVQRRWTPSWQPRPLTQVIPSSSSRLPRRAIEAKAEPAGFGSRDSAMISYHATFNFGWSRKPRSASGTSCSRRPVRSSANTFRSRWLGASERSVTSPATGSSRGSPDGSERPVGSQQDTLAFRERLAIEAGERDSGKCAIVKREPQVTSLDRLAAEKADDGLCARACRFSPGRFSNRGRSRRCRKCGD